MLSCPAEKTGDASRSKTGLLRLRNPRLRQPRDRSRAFFCAVLSHVNSDARCSPKRSIRVRNSAIEENIPHRSYNLCRYLRDRTGWPPRSPLQASTKYSNRPQHDRRPSLPESAGRSLHRKTEIPSFAGVVELKQFIVIDEARKDNSIGYSRLLRRVMTRSANQVFLPTMTSRCGSCGFSTNQFLKCSDQPDLVLSGLQIAHRQNEWPTVDLELLRYTPERRFMRHRAEGRRHRDRHHVDFVRIGVVSLQEPFARELARGDYAGRPLDRAADRYPQLLGHGTRESTRDAPGS